VENKAPIAKGIARCGTLMAGERFISKTGLEMGLEKPTAVITPLYFKEVGATLIG
jgi:hypothetical protein